MAICRSAFVALVAFSLMFCAADLFAAERLDIQTGTLVRATLIEPASGSISTPKTVIGVCVDATATALVLQPHGDGAPLTLQLSNVERLERNLQEGRRNKGAKIGAGIAMVAGATFILVASAMDDEGENEIELNEAAVIGALSLVLAPVGAAIGALVSPGARWEDIPVDQIRLSIGTAHGNDCQIGLAWKF